MLTEIVGTHPTVQRLRSSLPGLGAQRLPLVIVGERGVGKSLAAVHVHRHSEHSDKSPALLNASTLDERDQRILLLGGEPRLLTTTRRSILENHTTVVLKHVDHLPPHLQDELARSLLSMSFRRPGSDELRAVLCRPVFTVRETPHVLHGKGRLTDLLHNLLRSFRSFTIPPLRRRPDDVSVLTLYFMRQITSLQTVPVNQIRGRIKGTKLDPRLLLLLRNQTWKGNVMELKSFVQSLVMIPFEKLINVTELQEVNAMLTNVEDGREFSLEAALSRVEQAVVARALNACRGNVRKAGQLLGMTESAMHRRKATLTLIMIVLSSNLFIVDLFEMSLSFL